MTTLQKYFGEIWKPDLNVFTHTGWDILKKINVTDSVLDVGCGYNLYKPILGDQLYGIDPFNDAADQMISIEDFSTDLQYDVILCFGSINFGGEDVIKNQVAKVASLSKAGGRIYWRQNPARKDHPWPECNDIDFYNWSFEKNLEFAKQVGCEVRTLTWDNNRIYAEWIKN